MAINIFEDIPYETNQTGDPYGHLPTIDEDIFADNPNAAYMVALAAVPGEVLMPRVFEATRELRYSKYTELGWLPVEHVVEVNGKRLEPLDKYDATSEHVAVIKNRGSDKLPVLIASGRSIIKASEDANIPVEEHFPEVFRDGPAPVGSNEVSRLISDSLHRPERALASIAVQRAITSRCIELDYGPSYAMIEQYLKKRLDDTRFPHEMISDFQPIPEYNDTMNAVMLTDWRRVLAGTRLAKLGVPLTTKLFFVGVDKPGGGFGYYGKRFVYRHGAQLHQVAPEALGA